jgi:hypothetical protein
LYRSSTPFENRLACVRLAGGGFVLRQMNQQQNRCCCVRHKTFIINSQNYQKTPGERLYTVIRPLAFLHF